MTTLKYSDNPTMAASPRPMTSEKIGVMYLFRIRSRFRAVNAWISSSSNSRPRAPPAARSASIRSHSICSSSASPTWRIRISEISQTRAPMKSCQLRT